VQDDDVRTDLEVVRPVGRTETGNLCEVEMLLEGNQSDDPVPDIDEYAEASHRIHRPAQYVAG